MRMMIIAWHRLPRLWVKTVSYTHLDVYKRQEYNYTKFEASDSKYIDDFYGYYNLVRNSKQENSNRETFDYYLGGNTNVNLPWQISISTDVNCRFKDRCV